MVKTLLTSIVGTKHERDLKELLPTVNSINELEAWAMSLSKVDFHNQTTDFKKRIQEKGEPLNSILPSAFAMVREAARRTIGERHYDVQLMGGIVLHQGKIMEMKTGEGKTLSSVTAAYLNALTGKGVHIVTVNDYLATRDAEWMEPIYSYLGVTVGSIEANMDNETRKKAYAEDITYGTNNEFGFDYLRDNMQVTAGGKVQREHHFCIIDEIDSILIDEARTPLIISGQAEDDTKKFFEVNRLVHRLEECAKDPDTGEYPEEDPIGDYQIEEKNKKVTFTDQGMNHIEKLLQQNSIIHDSLFTDENFEYIHYFTQSVKAHRLFQKDVDYVVQENQVQIVDEFTGRIMYGRRYSDGLHQAIEAKEVIKIARRNRTLATITFQNFFRMYNKVSGMTGTADTEAREFGKIYNLEVVVIPTNRPLARIDQDDVIYLNENFKFIAICDEIEALYNKGQPILVGTVSIEKSEFLASLLTKRGIRHEVLNAKNHAREALIIAEAGAKSAVTIATNMAGRGTDIKLGGNPEYRARKKCGTQAGDEEYQKTYEKEHAKWLQDYEDVKEREGLYILGTERHESRRIDNQLRGRSGRQGDPGISRFFLSLDDALMRLFAKDNIKNLMSRFGMAGGEPLYHPLINKAIERAQTRVEERNFEIRKHLLEYDDVLNEQRTFIYKQRDTILTDTNLKERVLHAAKDMTEDAVDEYFAELSNDPDIAYANLSNNLKELFFYSLDLHQDDPTMKSKTSLTEHINRALEVNIQEKVDTVGLENFNAFIRYHYLRHIDSRWQEHLETLEALREAVYLRSYGQKNPLLEYKLEGFDIFDKLIYSIRTHIAGMVLKVQISKPEPGRYRRPMQATASKTELGQFAAGAGAGAGPQGSQSTAGAGGSHGSASQPQSAQVTRTLPKVGRNDPCPCGSGKKYKHCCGR